MDAIAPRLRNRSRPDKLDGYGKRAEDLAFDFSSMLSFSMKLPMAESPVVSIRVST